MVGIDIFIAFGLGTISGILAGVAVKLIVDYHYRPIIRIEDDDIQRGIDLTEDDGSTVHFVAHRIVVRNRGKTAAENCKPYINISKNEIERAAWMLPDETKVYTVTLNVDDIEYVDLYAVTQDGLRCVIPTEVGYSKGRIAHCRLVVQGFEEIPLRITSSNAKPADKKIRIHGR